MIKYLTTKIVFQEVPDETSLAISITGCKIRCKNCHSKELWKDIGNPLTESVIDKLIKKNTGITCVCFMGGEHLLTELTPLFSYVRNKGLKVAWYCGIQNPPLHILIQYLDYIKVGPYIEERGGLDNPNTNQRFYVVNTTTNKEFKYFLDRTKLFNKTK